MATLPVVPRVIWALIPAAGVGSRMQTKPGEKHKALLKLEGVPLIRRSLERLFECQAITGAVVATHPDDLAAMATLLKPLQKSGAPKIFIVPGGATRQASCHAALKKAGEEMRTADAATARVLFHDAARPLVTAAEIHAVLAALDQTAVAVLATPVTQTVKRADPAGLVEATVPRDRLYLAQTPQAFRYSEACQVFEYAAEAGFEATDDVALAEYRGLPVKIVPGSPWNLKITTPDDLELAKAILKLQGRA